MSRWMFLALALVSGNAWAQACDCETLNSTFQISYSAVRTPGFFRRGTTASAVIPNGVSNPMNVPPDRVAAAGIPAAASALVLPAAYQDGLPASTRGGRYVMIHLALPGGPQQAAELLEHCCVKVKLEVYDATVAPPRLIKSEKTSRCIGDQAGIGEGRNTAYGGSIANIGLNTNPPPPTGFPSHIQVKAYLVKATEECPPMILDVYFL